MTDGNCPRSRDVDRLETEQRDLRREVREEYVRKDVYLADQRADRASIKQLQDDDTSKATGNRTWLLGLVQAAFGAAVGLLGAYLMAKGH